MSPEAPPLRIIVNGENNHQIWSDSNRSEPINPKTTSPTPRWPPSPSPSTSRAKPSPDRSFGKKKSPEKPIIDEGDDAKFLLQRPAETCREGDEDHLCITTKLRGANLMTWTSYQTPPDFLRS
ncbi:hypothetical protein U1Q18_016549 [Sarracenia purpurea var. burkii]